MCVNLPFIQPRSWNKLSEKVYKTYWNQPGLLLHWSQLNILAGYLDPADVRYLCETHSEMFLTAKICKLPVASRLWLLLPPRFLTSFNIYIFLWHQNAADLTTEEWIWSRALALFFKRKQVLIFKISKVLSLGVPPWNLKHLQDLSCNCHSAKCCGSVLFYRFKM